MYAQCADDELSVPKRSNAVDTHLLKYRCIMLGRNACPP